MKKLLINSGRVVAISLMLAPIVILSNYEKMKSQEFWFYLICFILYDIYMYTVITTESKDDDEPNYLILKK